MNLIVDKLVDNIDLKPFMQYVVAMGSEYFDRPMGDNHVKLFAYLSKQLPDFSTVLDLGTLYGQSALGWAYNPKVQVITVDIEDHVAENQGYKTRENIKFVKGNAINLVDTYLDNTLVVFIDVAPHDGLQEQDIISILEEANYRGIVVLDDLFYNDEMRTLWNRIEGYKKIDVTKFGHWSGTGIVIFDESYVDVNIL